MYENILASKANYERALRSARSELERKKINNERIDQFKKELAEDRTLYNEASKYVNAVKIVQTAVVKEARDYQTRRIDYLNDIITEAVGKIFPDRNVTAKLDCDFSRTDKVSLHLYDENGDSFSPRISEGKLMQYLISVSAVAAITKSLGVHNIYIDEAFGVARIDHLDDLGELLQGFVDDGLQTVIVSQNPALYNNLSRHEIYLETVHDGNQRFAKVAEIKDV